MQSNMSPEGSPPENHLVWAILCTVLCCMPLGVIAIIKASKVKDLWYQRDYTGAHKAADDARKYAIWGAVIGPIIIIGFYILAFIVGIAGAIANV